MSKSKKRVKTGRVKTIGISKVYNTGNYTNVRYEIQAELSPGDSAGATMIEIARIINALRPITIPSCIDQLNAARAKLLLERSHYEKENYSSWLKQEEQYNRLVAKRKRAVEDLDRLGGTATFKDAKLSWDDNEDYF